MLIVSAERLLFFLAARYSRYLSYMAILQVGTSTTICILILSAEGFLFYWRHSILAISHIRYTASWKICDTLYTDLAWITSFCLAAYYPRYISHMVYYKLEHLRHSVYWSCLQNTFLCSAVQYSRYILHKMPFIFPGTTLSIRFLPNGPASHDYPLCLPFLDH